LKTLPQLAGFFIGDCDGCHEYDLAEKQLHVTP